MAPQVSQVVEKKHPKPVVKPGEIHKFTGQVILTALSLSSTHQPINPSTPDSDASHPIYPNRITLASNIKVMKIKEMIARSKIS